MPGIYHDVTINTLPERAFEAITQPEGLNAWWTLACEGSPDPATSYRFYFGPDYDWYAEVQDVVRSHFITWKFTHADADWTGTKLHVAFEAMGLSTRIRLEHTGWLSRNDHFRRTSYCWAQYLRLLKQYLERGISIPYRERQAA